MFRVAAPSGDVEVHIEILGEYANPDTGNKATACRFALSPDDRVLDDAAGIRDRIAAVLSQNGFVVLRDEDLDDGEAFFVYQSACGCDEPRVVKCRTQIKHLLAASGMAKSISAAERLIKAGAVSMTPIRTEKTVIVFSEHDLTAMDDAYLSGDAERVGEIAAGYRGSFAAGGEDHHLVVEMLGRRREFDLQSEQPRGIM